MKQFSEVCEIIPGLPDWQIARWESEHQASLPNLTERQWLEVFPEAKDTIARQKKEAEQRATLAKNNLLDYFRTAKPNPSGWFLEEVAREFWGRMLEKSLAEVKRCSSLLRQKQLRQKERLDKDTILRNPRMSMLDLARRETVMRPAGAKKWIGKCPFHSEKTPSFYVFEDKDRERFYCFGCGAKGDLVDFVCRTESMDFRTALEYLA